MTYIVPDYTAQTDPFSYRLPGWDTDVELASFNHLPTRQIARLASAARGDDMTPLITALAGGREDVADALWDLPVKGIVDLYTAWQQAAGVTQGESRASSTS